MKKYTSGSFTAIKYGIYKEDTDTITSFPAAIIADGENASAKVYGNMQQTGTPTPSSPIQPQECGERTANLCNEEYPNISGTIQYTPIYVGEGSFTLSTTLPYASNGANLFLLSGNVSTGASTSTNGVWLNHNITTQSEEGYITIGYRHYTGTKSPADSQTMLNTGSSALTYEPYGYKIPISSANTTTPIYLGEVQTTRKINKLTFSSSQNWQLQSINSHGIANFYIIATNNFLNNNIISNYFTQQTSSIATTTTEGIYIALTSSSATIYIRINSQTASTVQEFKDWLDGLSEEAALWYILAESTTVILNEPIRKIDNYADTVTTTIPTIAAADNINVSTTLKPSAIDLTYTGWHKYDDKKRSGGAWT